MRGFIRVVTAFVVENSWVSRVFLHQDYDFFSLRFYWKGQRKGEKINKMDFSVKKKALLYIFLLIRII